MQISHILNKEYLPERFDTLSVTAIWFISIAVRYMTGNPNHYVAWFAMIVCICDCMKFGIVLARRMADMLGIHIFLYIDKAKKN